MRKHSFIIKSVAFLLLLTFILLSVNHILLPKYIYSNNLYPSTSSYHHFYEMEKDSVDVLFLGPSIVVNAFSPQQLYDEYGIRSYNLGNARQDMLLSYYWLKEALNYQTPKVVVIDSLFLFHRSIEGLIRACLDPMKLSPAKLEAARDLSRLDGHSFLSYIFPNIRFHSRWSSLSAYDYLADNNLHSELKGYFPLYEYDNAPVTKFVPTDPEFSEVADNEDLTEYLAKIAELCNENGIKLIVTSLPDNEMHDGIHNFITRLSNELDFDYLNLTEARHIEALAAEPPREKIAMHQNLWGSIKTTRYIGRILSEEYSVPAVKDMQYEATRDFYQRLLTVYEIPHIDDFEEYLRALNNPDVSFFMSVQTNTAPGISEPVSALLKELGIASDLAHADLSSFAAIKLQDRPTEEYLSEAPIFVSGCFSPVELIYNVESYGYSEDKQSSIIIDGEEYSKKTSGLNIVVYDNLTGNIIDSVCFTTNLKQPHAVR